jgi:hypothetical protein
VEQNRGLRYESTYLIFDKGTNDEEKTASSTNAAGESGYLPAEN